LDRQALTEARQARLSVFPHAQLKSLRETVGKVPYAPWPEINGCLAVLFTARSGSTFLISAIEKAFAVGRMGESLNPAMVKAQPAAKIVRRRAGEWFAFKAGVPGVVAGEICGFFSQYLPQTSFMRLVRRDIVAQAVSFAKAEQTERWHLEDQANRTAIYDRPSIAKAVNNIVRGAACLKDYAACTGRPSYLVAYEDFAEGDFGTVFAACDAIGVPRRQNEPESEGRAVEKMSDAVNDEWRSRFIAEMRPHTRERIEQYQELIQS